MNFKVLRSKFELREMKIFKAHKMKNLYRTGSCSQRRSSSSAGPRDKRIMIIGIDKADGFQCPCTFETTKALGDIGEIIRGAAGQFVVNLKALGKVNG